MRTRNLLQQSFYSKQKFAICWYQKLLRCYGCMRGTSSDLYHPGTITRRPTRVVWAPTRCDRAEGGPKSAQSDVAAKALRDVHSRTNYSPSHKTSKPAPYPREQKLTSTAYGEGSVCTCTCTHPMRYHDCTSPTAMAGVNNDPLVNSVVLKKVQIKKASEILSAMRP